MHTKEFIDDPFKGYRQCWAKFITPTGNFPASYNPNRKLKILTGHYPTSDNVNWNMLKKIFLHIPNFISTRGGSNIDRGHYTSINGHFFMNTPPWIHSLKDNFGTLPSLPLCMMHPYGL